VLSQLVEASRKSGSTANVFSALADTARNPLASVSGLAGLVATLKEVESGANLSLLVPADEGVLYGAQKAADGAQLVSPLQAYLDLKSYRGRGEEAAQAVFEQVLKPTWA